MEEKATAKHTQQEMRIHAVEERASYEGSANVARRAANKDVGDVADVLLDIHSQVLKRRAKDRYAHPLQEHKYLKVKGRTFFFTNNHLILLMH